MRPVPGQVRDISIHAPVKGATPPRRPPGPARGHFNPRSREGSDIRRLSRASSFCYFNPRSREGSDLQGLAVGLTLGVISIHAPVKGATPPQPPSPGCAGISIHAPVKGATAVSNRQDCHAYFNPRSREGSDSDIQLMHFPVRISIHAPVKGATIRVLPYGHALFISIHAPVKGATPS